MFTANQSVDIFIPSYNEPLAMLEATIRSCMEIDYANKKVWLLDDGHRDEVAALTQALGCGYFARATNEGYKAGNLNNALPRTSADLICVFDADSLVGPSFLTRTVTSLMTADDVGFVQSKPGFYTPDLLNNFFEKEDGAATLREYYLRKLCCCLGSGFVVRRSALKSIGGFPTESITEDLLFSMKLLSAGWRSVYYDNEVLFSISRPNSLPGLVKQQVRWKLGAWQVFIMLRNFPFASSVSFAQRRMIFCRLLVALAHAAGPITILAPLIMMTLAIPADGLHDSIGLLSWVELFALLSTDFGLKFLFAVASGQTFASGARLCILMAYPLAKAFAGFCIKPMGAKFEVTPKEANVGPPQNAELIAVLGAAIVAYVFIGAAHFQAHASNCFDAVVCVWGLCQVGLLLSTLQFVVKTR